MINEKIIVGISALIGLLLFNKTKPVFLKVLLLILISLFIISFYEDSLWLNTISFFGFGMLSILFCVYNGIKKKWLNLIIGLFAFAAFFFKLNHYPFANELRLSMIIPILIYLVLLLKSKFEHNQLSILTILVAYELSCFLELLQ